jgi:hypothetical protein
MLFIATKTIFILLPQYSLAYYNQTIFILLPQYRIVISQILVASCTLLTFEMKNKNVATLEIAKFKVLKI